MTVRSMIYRRTKCTTARGAVVDDQEFEVFKELHTKTVFQYPESLDGIVWVTGEDLKALKTVWA